MESMTGFSIKNFEDKNFMLTVKLKSLNSRYLEVKTNVPSELFSLEKTIRDLVKKSIQRGGVEVNISYLDLDLSGAVKSLKPWVDSFKKTAKDLGVKDSLTLDSVMKKSSLLGGAVITKTQEKKILKVLSESLIDLKNERLKEGSETLKRLEKDLKFCHKLLKEIEKEALKAREELKESWKNKIDLIKQEVSEDRLALEVSILLEKADVSEELERLKIHFQEFEAILKSQTHLKGKRLDFYCQELNREANTIGSKIKNAAVIKYLMDLKSGLERIREQVQNIQ
jgi:uncharacterized protein (TIGR00255 family)